MLYATLINETGYLPIHRMGANLFFQLISRRYERGPLILTSNQSFGAWGEVFGDRVIATAIPDRLLHHAVTLNIRGNSYRLKEKLKACLGWPGRFNQRVYAVSGNHNGRDAASRTRG